MWLDDKHWADRFFLQVKCILGQEFICESTEEEDQQEATDLRILKIDGIRVAVRIRKNKWIDRCGNEFTIRASRPSGKITEIDKIMSGWGDFLFYGFSGAEEKILERWFIGSLKTFRWWFYHNPNSFTMVRNKDGSSSFYIFRISDLPSRFIKASSWSNELSNVSHL